MNEKLLTRDQFREGVFARDNHKCVICGEPAQDAHHIIERRLWFDGGYYLSNGASLCGEHHIQAETTDLSCDEIRESAKIAIVALPDGYYCDHDYTKWGDVILSNGNRMKGPLFNDESVQKILKQGNQYIKYTDYVKYPRTYHLPWSECIVKDPKFLQKSDKVIPNCSQFEGKIVVVTEKMDGENTTIYKDYIHARSIDGRSHWSRSRVKNLAGLIGYELGDYRICGENLQAKHSIGYDNLSSYFYMFSIWDSLNYCLSWKETQEWAEILNLTTVPVLYHGPWDAKLIQDLYTQDKRETTEGYVVRIEDGFHYLDFTKSLAKFVRVNHVDASNHHWMFTATEENTIGAFVDMTN